MEAAAAAAAATATVTAAVGAAVTAVVGGGGDGGAQAAVVARRAGGCAISIDLKGWAWSMIGMESGAGAAVTLCSARLSLPLSFGALL